MRPVWSITVIAACFASGASAQEGTAYKSGLNVANRRGYENAQCYAKVFAKHAVVVEAADGRRSWYAASTPAYNAEQRSRCGIDRLKDVAVQRENSRRGQLPGRNVQRVGLQVASERGYRGPDAACFARVYAIFASPQVVGGRVTYAVEGRSVNAYSQELFRECGISR